MVTIKHELFVEEIMLPLFERLDDSIKFLVIRGRSLSNVVEPFAKISDRVAFLAESAMDAYAQSIARDLKNF